MKRESAQLLTVAGGDPPPLYWGLRGPSCGTYSDFANLAFVNGDVDAESSHSDEPYKGHSGVAPVLVLGGDGEGRQALGGDPWAAGCHQHVVAGALEVKVPAIEGVVVGVAPQPARGLVVGHTHTLTALLLARLLWPTCHTEARFWGQTRGIEAPPPSIYPICAGILALRATAGKTRFQGPHVCDADLTVCCF